eukprot:g5144.t1
MEPEQTPAPTSEQAEGAGEHGQDQQGGSNSNSNSKRRRVSFREDEGLEQEVAIAEAQPDPASPGDVVVLGATSDESKCKSSAAVDVEEAEDEQEKTKQPAPAPAKKAVGFSFDSQELQQARQEADGAEVAGEEQTEEAEGSSAGKKVMFQDDEIYLPEGQSDWPASTSSGPSKQPQPIAPASKLTRRGTAHPGQMGGAGLGSDDEDEEEKDKNEGDLLEKNQGGGGAEVVEGVGPASSSSGYGTPRDVGTETGTGTEVEIGVAGAGVEDHAQEELKISLAVLFYMLPLCTWTVGGSTVASAAIQARWRGNEARELVRDLTKMRKQKKLTKKIVLVDLHHVHHHHHFHQGQANQNYASEEVDPAARAELEHQATQLTTKTYVESKAESLYQGSYNKHLVDNPPFESAEEYYSYASRLQPDQRLHLSPYQYTAHQRTRRTSGTTGPPKNKNKSQNTTTCSATHHEGFYQHREKLREASSGVSGRVPATAGGDGVGGGGAPFSFYPPTAPCTSPSKAAGRGPDSGYHRSYGGSGYYGPASTSKGFSTTSSKGFSSKGFHSMSSRATTRSRTVGTSRSGMNHSHWSYEDEHGKMNPMHSNSSRRRLSPYAQKPKLHAPVEPSASGEAGHNSGVGEKSKQSGTSPTKHRSKRSYKPNPNSYMVEFNAGSVTTKPIASGGGTFLATGGASKQGVHLPKLVV